MLQSQQTKSNLKKSGKHLQNRQNNIVVQNLY